MIGMNASTGRAISGVDHLYQSIADILTTPIGSRVMRRDYGSQVPEMIDHPLHGANVVRLYAATAYALMLWESRIRLTSVQLEISMDGAAVLSLDGMASGQYLRLSVPVKGAAA
jgi:uncharacterized protein